MRFNVNRKSRSLEIMLNSLYIDQVILKITSVCNLSCKYCYVFNKQDSSYLLQDDYMSDAVFSKAIERIYQYIASCPTHKVCITLHGGEPLMLNKNSFNERLAELRHILPQVPVFIQTNATLIDDQWCEILQKHSIGVGVSIDGYAKANISRIFKSGAYAYDSILRGIGTLSKNGIQTGILSVINQAFSPKEYYSFLKSIGALNADCLFPDATYETYDASNRGIGIWLCQLFDVWISDKHRIEIRLFRTIIELILFPSRKSGGEMLGRSVNGVIDITPSGAIDVPDTLKITGYLSSVSKYSVYKNNLNDICEEQMFKTYYFAHTDNVLAESCRKCLVKEICGGGLLAHRFSKANKFNNPTVYCYDMFIIIMHIQNWVQRNLALPLDKLSLQDYHAWQTAK